MRKFVIAVLLLAAGTLAGAAEKREEISRTFPASAGKLVLVDAGPLDLAVRVAEIEEIRVRVELVAGAFSEAQANAWIEAHRPAFEDREGELRLVAPDPGGVKLFRGVLVSRARVEMVLPLRVKADLSTSSGNLRAEGEFGASRPLRLRAASGDIEFVGWAPEVEARTTSGSIQIRATRTIERLLARSASGDVLSAGGVRALRADTTSGSVQADGLLGPAAVTTSGGSVRLRFDALAAGEEVNVTATSGRVRVVLPPETQAAGELVSARGEIRSEYPGESDAKGGKVRLAGTGPRVVITTTSGKIELL